MFLGSLNQVGHFGTPGTAAPVTHVVIGSGDTGIYQTVRFIKQKAMEALSQPVVINTVRSILSGIPASSSQTEKSKALVKWWMANIRYVQDDAMSWTENGLQWINIHECSRRFKQCEAVEMVSDVPQILTDRKGDCLPGDTLLLTPRGFKAISDIREGDTVMGDGDWVKVTNWWDKGILPTTNFRLSSGSTLAATTEHKFLTVPKSVSRDAVEVKASDLELEDFLLTPSVLKEGRETLDPDLAWLLGVYLADGWAEPSRAFISGKDGHPKEAQKKRVQEICVKRGWDTRWHERYIAINSKFFASLVEDCGTHAWNKTLPGLDFSAASARLILEGLSADASRGENGSLTYNTTSETLALQIRILHRMLGERTNIRRVDDHGGLGKHPIYRVGLIRLERADGRPPTTSVRVKDIQEGEELPVFDIEVEGHRFYLPEHDIIVHNCDDFVTGLGAFHSLIGVRWCPVVVALDPSIPRDHSHIYLIANLDGTMVPIDAVNAREPWNWEAENPFRKEVLC